MAKTLIFILMSSEIWCDCPESDLIWPCTCRSSEFHEFSLGIHCYDELGDDNRMSDIMDNLQRNFSAPKHYNGLYLLNTGIKELKENILKGITFDKIHVHNNENLTTIHENAFIGTENVTKLITIANNPKLTFENNSIFNFLSKFINAVEIALIENANITEIPTNAFAKSNDDELDNVHFEDDALIIENSTSFQTIVRIILFQVLDLIVFDFIPDNTMNVKAPRAPAAFAQMNKLKVVSFSNFTKINSYAFSSLNNLEIIFFHKKKFETIEENAFTFHHVSNKSLTIIFQAEDTNDFGFNEKSLININRPTKLMLQIFGLPKSGCYLDERIYLPFLLDNPKNTIEICYNTHSITLPWAVTNSSDARNLWF